MSTQNTQIPFVQTTDRKVNQLQQNIIQAVTPLLKNPVVNGGSILASQTLAIGNNTLAHGLGRTLQGWLIVRYHGAWAQIFDNQDTNSKPAVNLILNASAPVTVDVYVF